MQLKKLKSSVLTIVAVVLIGASAEAAGDQTQFYQHANAYFLEKNNPTHSLKLKRILMDETNAGRFTGPAHSMKINQAYAAQRGVIYLDLLQTQPSLFTEEERKSIESWFEKVTERAFTVEWSDFYYMLTFRKPLTAPYRNQENGAAALAVYAKIIEDSNPELARKARQYVEENGVFWRSNFRNTDDSTSYQALWIYNAWNAARFMFPETLTNRYSEKSFDWLFHQWPPNGAPLGYNPEADTILPDIFFLGAMLHKSPEFKWLAEKSLSYAEQNGARLSSEFRPGLQFKDPSVPTRKPTVGSTYIEAPGDLVQFPSEDRPDKMVFRSGWEDDSLYALLNLRYDGFHGYKATNCVVTLHYGVPFVVEDIVQIKRKWLPAGRSTVRDDNIDRSRLNGFFIEEPLFYRLFNAVDVLRTRWFETLPRHTKGNSLHDSDLFDYSSTEIIDWLGWTNSRMCLLVKDRYFVVFDFNRGQSAKAHAIAWHLRGEYDADQSILRQKDYKIQTIFLHDPNSTKKVQSSEEEHKPYNPGLEPDHDIFISSTSDHSEVVSIFAPVRQDIVQANLHAIDDRKICLNITYGEESDFVIVNRGGGPAECNGISTRADLLFIHDNKIYEVP